MAVEDGVAAGAADGGAGAADAEGCTVETGEDCVTDGVAVGASVAEAVSELAPSI